MLIVEVAPDTAAARARIHEGDHVLSVDGEQIDAPRVLSYAIAQKDPGEEVRLTIVRNGECQALTAAA